METGNGDQLWAVNAPMGRRAASGDANGVTVLGNAALLLGAGAGNAPDITLSRAAADVLELAAGDTFRPNTTGQDLGAAGNRWDVFAQDMNSSGAHTYQTVSKVFADSPYAVLATDHVILYDPVGGSSVVNLPVAVTGRRLVIKHNSASANTVTVDGNGTETIDGALTYVLATRLSITLGGITGVGWAIL
jgi:hypothetical protein